MFLMGLILSVAALAQSGGEDAEYMVWLKPARSDTRIRLLSTERQPFVVVDEAELNRLLEEGAVARYEEDQIVELLDGEPEPEPEPEPEAKTDPYYADQWNLDLLHADVPWAYGYTGSGVKVAVVDSGCYAHEDLQANLLPGHNYVGNSDDTNDTNDTYGHGTAVCGLIAAGRNGVGMIGVAPDAKIVPLKCFEDGTTKMSRIVQAVYDAVDVYGCQVINLSLGLKPKNYPTSLEEAISHARENGAVVVAAVGNEGNSDLYYPAAFSSVIGVGAIRSDKTRSTISQQNESVSLMAPGESILTTSLSGGYAIRASGATSFAAPHISGLAAILLSCDDTLTPEQVETILWESAEDLGETGYDTSYGYGLADAAASLSALLTGPWGDDLTWSLDAAADALTVAGEGAVPSGESPWAAYADKIKTVVLSGVTEVGEGAFSGCTGLTDVTFVGTPSQWSEVSIGDGNEPLTSAELHCTEDDPEPEPILGDVDGDGEVAAKDVTALRRYLAGGYDVTIAEAAADVNRDGAVNGKDVTYLRRALVGGYGVTLE